MSSAAAYVVRLAHADEIAALPDLETRAAARFAGLAVAPGVQADRTTLEDFERAQAAGLLWVAVAGDGTVVGFALAEILDGNAHLDELDVLPEHGRRGLGAALVREVCAAAARRGLPAVTLTTFRDVAWNAPFYTRLGFAPLLETAWTPGLTRTIAQEAAIGLDPATRVVMRRPLTAAPGHGTDAPAGLDPRPARNKRIVEQWLAALTAGDADGVCALYAPDLRYFVVGDWPLGGHFDRSYMEQNCRDVFTVFPAGLRFTPERLVAEGDWVCLEMRSHGKHVSGRTYGNHYTYWFEIRDGKIVQLKEWLDTLHANDVLCGSGAAIDFETRRR